MAQWVLSRENWLRLLICETIAVTAFVATLDSVSAPCGLGSTYWDTSTGNYLQNIDATNTALRGLSWIAVFMLSVQKTPSTTSHFTALYAVWSAYLLIFSLVTAWDVMGLDCPNSSNIMSCTGGATYWMVPRNYCAAQIANNQACHVNDADRVQMCVRLGRAPLVNGAFAAWFVRTLGSDALRAVLLGYSLSYSEQSKTQKDEAVTPAPEQDNSPPVGQPNTATSETASLLHDTDDDVIRQSPCMRKRAASAFNIQF